MVVDHQDLGISDKWNQFTKPGSAGHIDRHHQISVATDSLRTHHQLAARQAAQRLGHGVAEADPYLGSGARQHETEAQRGTDGVGVGLHVTKDDD